MTWDALCPPNIAEHWKRAMPEIHRSIQIRKEEYMKATKLKLKPISDYVLIRGEPAETKTKSGLHIPGEAQSKCPLYGEVLAVGPGRIATKTGELIPMSIRPGQRVFFDWASGLREVPDQENMLMLRESEVLAVVES